MKHNPDIELNRIVDRIVADTGWPTYLTQHEMALASLYATNYSDAEQMVRDDYKRHAASRR